jgi:hypothetical protein
MIGILNALTLSVLALAAPVPSPSPSTAASGCSGPLAHRLDFWIGTWDVRNPAGSLFYIDGPGRRWKQVWVTDTGAFKEKGGHRVPGWRPFPG